MLDIVIDFINQKAGGATKYINQRDSDFIGAFLQEENYRKEFTDALRDYVDMEMPNTEYTRIRFIKAYSGRKPREYKQILKLSSKDRVRDTFYSEILTLIASYECGLAELIKQQSEKLEESSTTGNCLICLKHLSLCLYGSLLLFRQELKWLVEIWH